MEGHCYSVFGYLVKFLKKACKGQEHSGYTCGGFFLKGAEDTVAKSKYVCAFTEH